MQRPSSHGSPAQPSAPSAHARAASARGTCARAMPGTVTQNRGARGGRAGDRLWPVLGTLRDSAKTVASGPSWELGCGCDPFKAWRGCAGAGCCCSAATAIRDRGAAGESCTRRDDCESGLSCLAQVCSEPRRDGGSGGTDAPPPVGGRCEARNDCEEGLVCTNNVCMAASAGVDPGARYSGRGESCEAKNDCSPELACVMGSCREVTLELGHTPKECHRVECEDDDACCADFMPNANCDAYRMNCETDPIFCNTYRSLCQCNKSCVDEICVAAAPGCTTNTECTSQQTPYCVDGRCRQCDRDSSCPGAGHAVRRRRLHGRAARSTRTVRRCTPARTRPASRSAAAATASARS